jgi:protein involved in polysaccharide export with SLBB domain
MEIQLARRILTLLPIAAMATTGCAPKRTDILHFLREREHQVSATEYRVGIPDGISISAPRILEIEGEDTFIRPDGKINLRLLGDIKIVGMTAREIAAKLEVLLSRYYTDPKVTVRVTGYNSKKYYVYGRGRGTGPRPYTGRDTLLDVVLPSTSSFAAWTSRVRVIRPSHGDTPVREIEVDVDKMLETGDWSRNILLEPNDIVYIPPTPGAWLADRVYSVLLPIIPAVQAYAAPAQFQNLSELYKNDNAGSNTFLFGSGFGGGGGGIGGGYGGYGY